MIAYLLAWKWRMALLGQKEKAVKLLLNNLASDVRNQSLRNRLQPSSPTLFCLRIQIHTKYFSLYSHATLCSPVFDPCRHPVDPSWGKVCWASCWFKSLPWLSEACCVRVTHWVEIRCYLEHSHHHPLSSITYILAWRGPLRKIIYCLQISTLSYKFCKMYLLPSF